MRLILSVMSIFFLLSFVSCSGSLSQNERRAIEDTVRKYNNALMEAYRTGDFTTLKKVATERQSRKVMVYIQSYAAVGEKIVSELKSFGVKDIIKKGYNKVEVTTSEEWIYSRIEHNTGRVIVPETLYMYEMRYEVVKDKDNKWKVSALKVLKEEKKTL